MYTHALSLSLFLSISHYLSHTLRADDMRNMLMGDAADESMQDSASSSNLNSGDEDDQESLDCSVRGTPKRSEVSICT
jgi:hypothetical protein